MQYVNILSSPLRLVHCRSGTGSHNGYYFYFVNIFFDQDKEGVVNRMGMAGRRQGQLDSQADMLLYMNDR